MLASLCWVPRGAAKTKFPEGVEENSEIEVDPPSERPIHQGKSQDDTDGRDGGTMSNDNTGFDVEVSEILSKELDKLAFYKRDQKDPYLASDPKANELFDEEELNDLTVRETDSLIVSVTCSEDASTLQVHLFDDNPDESDDEVGAYVPHTYVHHDIILPSLPLCTAYNTVESESRSTNLVAVGMFTPGIDIWDIDRVNNLEPVQSLGGYDTSGHSSGALRAPRDARGNRNQGTNPKQTLLEGSHEDAVMCLSWNRVQHEYLASGSADTTVKIWDIESAHCACTLSHHSGKVQAVAFHPSKENILLSGSFDKTVCISDLRDQAKTSAWSVTADIETCCWGCHSGSDIIVGTTEDGYACIFDPRGTDTNHPVARWRVHEGPASACSVSTDIPGLMVTGGVDKMLRVWDISSFSKGEAGLLVYERNARSGALFSVSICPLPRFETNASPFVVAFGGAKGSVGVTDVAVESEAVRTRFLAACPPVAADVIRKRAMRGVAQRHAGSQSLGPREDARESPDESGTEDDISNDSDYESSHED